MIKKLLLFLLLSMQTFLFGKSLIDETIFVDTALKHLSVPDQVSNPQSFHILSHAKSGELFINNEWLNAVDIASKFKNQLAGKKELYIYGCNFGAGKKGIAAVNYLEKILKIKVSASNNITGKDGDWILEVGKGKNQLKHINYSGNLQLDNTHYLNPVLYSVYSGTSTIGEEYIYLSTPETGDITVQMSFPVGSGAPRVSVTNLTTSTTSYVSTGSITFNNANPVRLQFVNASNAVIAPGNTPTTIPYNQAGTVVSGSTSGLVFNSTKKFYVNYRGRSNPQAGSVMTKGKAALGREFRWGGSPVEYSTTIPEVGNMLSVMSTEDGTTVKISNIKPGTKFRDGASGTTTITGSSITKILNRGQSFILYAPVEINNVSSPQNAGWLGAKVASDKDVSVIVGGMLQQGGSSDQRDIGLDQLVPKTQLGLEHIIMKGNGDLNEKVIVVATENNTVLYLNNTAIPFATLALAGDYILIPAANFNSANNMFVRVTQPAYVFHKIYGSSKSNTNSLMFIPPTDCFGQREVNVVADVRKIGTTVYSGTQLVVLAAAGTANKPIATLNGTVITSSAAGTVDGNPNWFSYRYNLGSDGNVKVISNAAIQAQIFGADDNAGFGGYYSGFGQTPTANVTIDTPYGSPCIGNSTLTVTSSVAGTYQWYKNNVIITGATSSTYQLTGPANAASATYYVIVTYPGGCTIRSNELTSEVCPCPKPGATGTPNSYTDFGISSRDIRSTPDWPKDVPNGYITMESTNKGFVITRMDSPETSIASPTAGMLVYDTSDDCLKLYNGTTWKCIKQTCND